MSLEWTLRNVMWLELIVTLKLVRWARPCFGLLVEKVNTCSFPCKEAFFSKVGRLNSIQFFWSGILIY